VAGFWDQGYLKVKPGQKTVQLRMVKIDDVQISHLDILVSVKIITVRLS
jgi:hypothetical protein